MKYNLAFTAGALLYQESKLYVEAIEYLDLYLDGSENVDPNVLVTNAESSRKRLKAELDKRLKNLDISYLEFFKLAEEQDQKLILFLAICKNYPIVTSFCLEVIRHKWLHFDHDLTTYDFKYFMSTKLTEEQLNDVSNGSQYKLSQVAVKMVKDLGLYKDQTIYSVEPSSELKSLILKNQDGWFFDCILYHPLNED